MQLLYLIENSFILGSKILFVRSIVQSVVYSIMLELFYYLLTATGVFYRLVLYQIFSSHRKNIHIDIYSFYRILLIIINNYKLQIRIIDCTYFLFRESPQTVVADDETWHTPE